MNDDDEDGLGKELTGPTEQGVLSFWARVIVDLKASRVCCCFGREPESESFIDSTAWRL
jgi:hypothetical protein